ncbi:TIM barrel protein [Pontiellaceae bacterium B12219]|nr:TIM barrel protein [Pontiellaceae bacterium B12219]
MTAQPKFQWGISTLGCHELDLSEICQLAERHDIHALEIRSLADRQDLPLYLDETFRNAGEIQSILDKHKQRIIALNSGFSLIEAKDSDKEELLGFARWAELLNIPYIRAFGGSTMATPLTKEDLDLAVASFQWWEEIRLKNGWETKLALETHCGFSSSDRCLQLQKHLGHPIDIIWDTHHTWKYGKESAQDTWNQLAPQIRHVHIKDSISVPSARHPYSYVLPGTGEFPASEVLNLLASHNFDGIVSLEWERKWHPYMTTLNEALESLVSNHWKSAPTSSPFLS